MINIRISLMVGAAFGALFTVGSARAQTAAQVTLNKCQGAVQKEGKKYVQGEIATIAKCLQKISSELVKKNAADTSGAAATCVAAFRKLKDGRMLGKSLKEKLTTKIKFNCDPGTNPDLTHTVADITGIMPGVPQPISTKQVNTYCQRFGGDGSIDTVQEWIDCIVASHDCEARQAIAVQYPRAPEWLDEVQPFMAAILPPSGDPNKIIEAVGGLTAARTAIDANDDGFPDLVCGTPLPPTCSTACCYIEYILAQTSCFEYEGPAAQVTAFKANCGAATSSLPVVWTFAAVDGPCIADTVHSTPCMNGGVNWVQLPKDSSCP